MKNFTEDKWKILFLRSLIEKSKTKDLAVAKWQTEACEECVESMGYNKDILLVNDATLDILFGKPEVIEKDYLIK